MSRGSMSANYTKVLYSLLLTSLLIVALGTAPTQPTQAETVAPTGGVSPAGLLDPASGLTAASTASDKRCPTEAWAEN